MIDEFKLAELINSKFCHDLAGPIGAVNNGIEFLSGDDESIKERAINLIEVSSLQSTLRLQFFRQVYGSIPSEGEANLSTLKEVALNYFNVTKIKFSWDLSIIDTMENHVSHKVGKLLMNLFQIASGVLIKGGDLNSKVFAEDGKIKIIIKATGSMIKLDSEYEEILRGDIDEEYLSSKNIHVYYTYRILESLGVILEIYNNEDEFRFNLEVDQNKK